MNLPERPLVPAGPGLFITATDTEVGKTIVTAGLALALRERDLIPGVMKPVQTGSLAGDPMGDAMVLTRLAGVPEDGTAINLYSFELPVAPLVAARAANATIELEPIRTRAAELSRRYRPLLVEGLGGLAVPVGEGWTMADLAKSLELPLVIVARAGLGTINHTVLTIRVAEQTGLVPAAVVLNEHGQEPDASWATNPALIEDLGGVPVIGRLPSIDPLTPERLREAMLQHLDIGALLPELERIA